MCPCRHAPHGVVPLDPSQEQRISTLESMQNPSKWQKQELKSLKNLRWIKTRTVRGREGHTEALETVDQATELLMTMERTDVPSKYKLPDGKLKHLMDYCTEVPARHIESPYTCVTSSTVDEERFKKRFGLGQ